MQKVGTSLCPIGLQKSSPAAYWVKFRPFLTKHTSYFLYPLLTPL